MERRAIFHLVADDIVVFSMDFVKGKSFGATYRIRTGVLLTENQGS